MTPRDPAPRSLTRRLIWFVALWSAGVITVGIVSYLLRLWIAPH